MYTGDIPMHMEYKFGVLDLFAYTTGRVNARTRNILYQKYQC